MYECPLYLAKQKLDEKILTMMGLPLRTLDMSKWEQMVSAIKKSREAGSGSARKKDIHKTIAIVGKYFATGEYQLRDSYAALMDAIDHASWALGVDTTVKWIQAEKLEKARPLTPERPPANDWHCRAGSDGERGDLSQLTGVDGIIVPIGWGARGVEGKITAINFARTHKIPYLGLCYGMQLAVVEYARNVVGLTGANTLEVDADTSHPVIHMISGQEEILKRRAYGGTMRLGRWECRVKPGTIADGAYMKHNGYDDPKNKIAGERHRHRYELNNAYAKQFEDAGLVIAGRSVVENLVEIIELPTSIHPFFLGTQYHPEYRSRPLEPHPIFLEYVKAL